MVGIMTIMPFLSLSTTVRVKCQTQVGYSALRCVGFAAAHWFVRTSDSPLELQVRGKQAAMLPRIEIASGVRSGAKIVIDRLVNRLASSQGNPHVDDASIAAVASTGRKAESFELIEGVRHGGARDGRVLSEDRSRDWFRLERKQHDKSRKLQVAQLVTSDRAPEAAAQSFGGAKMSKNESATRGIDPGPPAGEREECAR